MFTAKGINGTVTFDGQTVSLEKKVPLQARQGAKTYPIRSIGAVQYKPATSLVNGYLQFSILGEASKATRPAWTGVSTTDLAKDENAVIFRKSALADFDALVAAVREAQAAGDSPTAADPVQQIADLAKLRDQGILTEDEFASKKAALLERL